MTFIFVGTQLPPLFQLDSENNYAIKKEERFNIHLCRNSTATFFGFQLDPENNYTEKNNRRKCLIFILVGNQQPPLLVFNLILKITTLKTQDELFNIHFCRNSTDTSFGFQLDSENSYTEKNRRKCSTFIFVGTQLPSLLGFNLILKITTLKKRQERPFSIHLCRN